MRRRRRDSGFSLSALIFFATAASIFIAAAIPAYQMQAKREVEEELIFRGGEYARAIQKYQRRFGVYPSSIDQLISANGLRFLRKPYKDPVTGKDFRLITLNPDGSLSGSKVFEKNVNTQSLFVDTQDSGKQQSENGSQTPPTHTFQQSAPSGQRLGFPSAGSQQARTSASFQQFQTQQPGPQGAGSLAATPFGVFSGSANTSPFAAGGIVGVASDSEEKSVKVYNGREKYDEWEFLAVFGQQGAAGQRGNGPQQENQTPNQPFNPKLGGPRPANPFQSTPFQPQRGSFGGQAFPPPAGGQPGSIQTPFGFRGAPQQAAPPQPGRP